MFPIKCKAILPVDHIVVNAISVRGRLGPLTVWVSNDPTERNRAMSEGSSSSPEGRQRPPNDSSNTRCFHMKERYWTKIYERTHSASPRKYEKLDLSEQPIIMRPGEVRAVYVHSTLEGDQAIVYDNKHKKLTHNDSFLSVLPGRAHVSCEVFGATPIWGWGSAWRDNREFVGRLHYGVVYKLWNPHENQSFGNHFRGLARILFACQRRWESPMSMLPDECIFYILNMCRWDWMNDSPNDMRAASKKRRLQLQQQQQQHEVHGADDTAVAREVAEDDSHGSDEESDVPYHEYYEEDEEFVDGDMVDDDDDDDDWDEDDEGGYEPDAFRYQDVDSEESEEEDREEQNAQSRRQWLRSHFTRIQVLRALDNGSRGEVVMQVDPEV